MDTGPRRYRSTVTVGLLLAFAACALITNPGAARLLPLAPATVFAQEPMRLEPVERDMMRARERLRSNGITPEKLNAVQQRFEGDQHVAALPVAPRTYQIEGLRRDGRVDRAALSATALRRAFGNDYFSALPQDKDQYESVSVWYLPDNSDVGHGWKSVYANTLDPLAAGKKINDSASQPGSKAVTSPPANPAGRRRMLSPLEAQMRLMNVTRMSEGTVIDILTPGANGGTNRWYVTDEEKGATGEIGKWIDQSGSVVHAGDELPADWIDSLFASNRSAYLRRSERSANRLADLQKAAELGRKPLDASRLKLFNALPQETSLVRSFRESLNMDLQFSDREPWRELNTELKATAISTGVPVVAAKKQEVMHELQHGSSDIVFIVAHGTGASIYLPGTAGEPISASDLAQIQRFIAPERLAILITCKGGEVNGNAASISEALLHNKLVRAVFASSEDVDARQVPALVRELVESGRPVQEVMSDHKFRKIAQDFLRALGIPNA